MFTRRIIGFGIGGHYIDGPAVCRAIAGQVPPVRISTDHVHTHCCALIDGSRTCGSWLDAFQRFYNQFRVHRSLYGYTPENRAGNPSSSTATVVHYGWKSHCHLILDIPGMIEMASRTATLLPGDIIATGTPEGVGPMKPGDKFRIAIEHLGEMNIDVVLEQR